MAAGGWLCQRVLSNLAVMIEKKVTTKRRFPKMFPLSVDAEKTASIARTNELIDLTPRDMSQIVHARRVSGETHRPRSTDTTRDDHPSYNVSQIFSEWRPTLAPTRPRTTRLIRVLPTRAPRRARSLGRQARTARRPSRNR